MNEAAERIVGADDDLAEHVASPAVAADSQLVSTRFVGKPKSGRIRRHRFRGETLREHEQHVEAPDRLVCGEGRAWR